MKEKMMDTNYAFKNSENVFVPKQYTEEKKRTTLLLCIFGGWIRDIVCLMNGSGVL